MNYREQWEQLSYEFRASMLLQMPYWDETYDWHNALLMGGEIARGEE